MKIKGKIMSAGELRDALNLLPDDALSLPVYFTGYTRMEESNGVVVDYYDDTRMLIITAPGSSYKP